MLVARVEVLGSMDARGSVRFSVDAESTLRDPGGRPFHVLIDNFSRGGFLFLSDVEFAAGTLIAVGLAGAGQREAQVIWRDGSRHGCEFLVPLPQSMMARAFRGNDAVLADLETELRKRLEAAEARDPDPWDVPEEAEAPVPPRTWRAAIGRLLRRIGLRR